MKILHKYLTIFSTASFIGALTLRWLALEFLYHKMGDFWSGIGTTVIATGGLAVIIGVLIGRHIAQLERVVEKVRNGEAITQEDRKTALGVYAKVNKITITANVVGFIIGQFVVMFLDIKAGVVPYHFSCSTIIMIQSTLVGTIAALYEIYSLNILMADYRKLLRIHSIDEFGNGWNLTISGKILVSCVATLLFMGVNAFAAAYGIIALPGTIGGSDELGTYLRFGIEAVTFTFAVCFFLFFIVSQELKTRISDTASRLKDLGDKGDLSYRISLSMNDDFGVMTSDLNGFITQLGNLVRNMHAETAVVATSAQALSSSVNDSFASLEAITRTVKTINDGEQEQSALIGTADSEIKRMAENAKYVEDQVMIQSTAVEQSSASVNEMAANISSVAEMTQKADALALTLKDKSDEGTVLLSSAVTAIKELQEVSGEVQKIVQVIQSIANSTNLLSMNAAIEAAHAGEAGKGFAVVADEVRSLATSSTKSTAEIKKLIAGMLDKTRKGVDAIANAGKAFSEISAGIGQTTELIQTIANAMEEQRTGATETIQSTNSVVDAIRTIQDLARKQRESTENMENAVRAIVDAEREIHLALEENSVKTGNLDAAIRKVEKSMDANKQAVANMQTNIQVFKL
jgi:methyl-accepting chemotaxis protein